MKNLLMGNPIVKLRFLDFWDGFEETNNFLYHKLSEKYMIVMDDKPDFVIFSNYGTSFYKYKCTRIFYSRENQRPDFTICDYAITSDWIKRRNHYTFPVFGSRYAPGILISDHLVNNAHQEFLKRKFCCFVISNGKAKERIAFFDALSTQYKKVDSGGQFLNNIGVPVKDKDVFLRKYKFVIAFENSSYPGYTTEKLYDALVAGCIPIYWGDPQINKYFNENRFVNCSDLDRTNEIIQRIINIDKNDNIALEILKQPCFNKNEINRQLDHQNLLLFFEDIFNNQLLKPIAKSIFNKVIHILKLKKNVVFKKYLGQPPKFR